MNILAISDLHGELPKNLPSADTLVIAGDVCPDTYTRGVETTNLKIRRRGYGQEHWVEDKLLPWLISIESNYNNIILTWGNHDFVDDFGEPVAWELVDNVLNLRVVSSPEILTIGNYIFYVSPYCSYLPEWAYNAVEQELWNKFYRHIPIGTDVIVSHGPALDYLDRCADGRRVGSRALKEAIKRVRPSVVINGHIHESFGKYELNHAGTSHKTFVYNVSQRDEYYNMYNRPVAITLEPRRGIVE